MSDWQVRVPRESPEKGYAFFAFGWKVSGGLRKEISGTARIQRIRLIEKILKMEEEDLAFTYHNLSIDMVLRQRKEEPTDGQQREQG